jgi:uncharacterized protein
MIEIIKPNQFKTVPWKNDKGETVEMAINPGGTLESFDWRLSMASVIEDGVFSNFSGYTRNLILIAGDSINLQHNDCKINRLTQLLDVATFDGGDKTVGNLPAGEITDFNIIARTSSYKTQVSCQRKANIIQLAKSELCFIYSLFNSAELTISNGESGTNEVTILPAGHLVKMTKLKAGSATLNGDHLIIVYLTAVKS